MKEKPVTPTGKMPALAQMATQDLLQWTVPRLIGAGYGLFSKKAANPRWPEFIITAFVIKKYRQKSSFWFMVMSAAKGMRRHEIVAGEAKALLAKLIGSKPADLYRLSGIYRAIRDEKGPAIATAAIVEIIRTTNLKRSQKKSWIKPENQATKLRYQQANSPFKEKIQKKSKSHK